MPARVCLSVFYRSPSSAPETLDAVCDYFNSIDSAQYTNFVFIGDFNIDMSTCSHPQFHKLNNIMSTYNLSQMVTEEWPVIHQQTNLKGKWSLEPLLCYESNIASEFPYQDATDPGSTVTPGSQSLTSDSHED